MVDHHVSEYHDPEMAIPGHASHLVYVHETRDTGLHCGGDLDGCGWFGGGFKGRWADKHMREAWQRHVAFVEAGGVLEHGRVTNVDEGTCRCVRCMIPWRARQTTMRS